MEITKTTSLVTVLDLLPGDVPAILTQEKTKYKGSTRLFTQKVPIRDSTLFQQLCAQIHKGDQIETSVVTEWYEARSVTYLESFAPVACAYIGNETEEQSDEQYG